MGIVVAPNQVLETNQVAGGDAGLVVLERHVEISTEVLRRLHGEVVDREFRSAIRGVIEPLEKMGHPAGLELGHDEFESRESLYDAAADQVDHRVDHGGVGERVPLNRAGRRAPMRRETAIPRRTGEDVHGQRHPEVLRGSPEPVVIRMVVGLVDRRVSWNGEASYSPRCRPFDFGEGDVDIG